jgi:hypothetical protein
MLQKHGQFNDLSEKLRLELEGKVKELGNKVKFKFNISKSNPDPEKHDGAYIFPNMYTLDPRTFRILDPYEDRPGVSKSKEIGLVDKVDRDGKPESFHRIRINYREQGLKELNVTEKYDDFEFAMFLWMHPKLKGGQFQDSNKTYVFELIDEVADAKERKEKREARIKATTIARSMDDNKVKEFADAMQWSETDMEIIRDKVEELADTEPKFFNDFINGKDLEYQAVLKRALDKKIIEFDPAEYNYKWPSNNQVIVVLAPGGEKGHIEKLSDWCQTAGQKAEETYKRIKGLVK